MTRNERQAENIEKWKEVGCKASLLACTGYGKSWVAMKAFQRMKKKWPNLNALVVVPTNYLVEQWKENFKEFGLSDIKVVTIQKLLSIYDGDNPVAKVHLLIPDEIHKYTAEEFGKLYDIVDYQFILGLSATIPEDKREFIEEYAPICDEVTLDEALENEWVSPFIVYQLGVDLTDEEREEYNEYTDTFYKCFSWFQHDYKLIKSCSDEKQLKSHMRSIGERITSGNIGRFKGYIARFWGSIQKRKQLLYNSESKLNACTSILEKFDDALAISFSQRTDFADQVADQFPNRCVPYHSSIDGKEIDGEYYGVERLKEKYIEDFSDPNSEVNILSTARALDMGADIPAIDLGIVTSGSSKSLQAIQRTGRVIRKVKGKRSILVDIYCKNTQDERWLKSRYSDFPKESIVRVNNIDQINYGL